MNGSGIRRGHINREGIHASRDKFRIFCTTTVLLIVWRCALFAPAGSTAVS